MRRSEDLVAFLANHGSPFGGGRLCAKAQEGECRRVENGGGNAQRAGDDKGRERVGQDVSSQNAP